MMTNKQQFKLILPKVEFMKLRNVTSPHPVKGILGLVGLGLIAFAAAPISYAAQPKDSQPVAAPAQAAPAQAAPAATPAKASAPAKSAGATQPVECVRTGQRVIAALARDDSGTASQFHAFYTAFKCPPQQLAQAFGCLVKLQAATPSLTNPSAEQVAACWDEAIQAKAQPHPPAAQ